MEIAIHSCRLFYYCLFIIMYIGFFIVCSSGFINVVISDIIRIKRKA